VSQRTQRLADQIQRVLADLVRRELKDPRLGMITISSVKVSPDMGYADVYVTVMGHTLEERPDESIAVLNAAAGFLRGELGRAVTTRVTPRLRFHFDEVTARGNRMAALINQAVQQDRDRADARGDDVAGDTSADDSATAD
jgi:ribosome-binding factor A